MMSFHSLSDLVLLTTTTTELEKQLHKVFILAACTWINQLIFTVDN